MSGTGYKDHFLPQRGPLENPYPNFLRNAEGFGSSPPSSPRGTNGQAEAEKVEKAPQEAVSSRGG